MDTYTINSKDLAHKVKELQESSPSKTIIIFVNDDTTGGKVTAKKKQSKINKLKLKSTPTKHQIVKEKWATFIQGIHNQIISNIHKEIPTIDTVIKEGQISLVTFKVMFKKIYGKPYYQYFLDYKLKKARALLMTGMYSVGEVSEMLGYSQPIKLIIPFKKRFKITPGNVKRGKLYEINT